MVADAKPLDAPLDLIESPIGVQPDTWIHVYPKAVIHPATSNVKTWRASWTDGKPRNILNHLTAVCGSTWPGFGRFLNEGIGSPFGIKRDGTVAQYVDLTASTWHAFGESHYGVGIELDASPATGCPVLPVQIDALVALNAWICKTFGIPAVRAPGVAYSRGIKCHTDGLEDGGKTWDPNGHYDAPWKATGDAIAGWIPAGTRAILDRSPISSGAFCIRVADIVQGDDMTPEEVTALATKVVCDILGVATPNDAAVLEASVKGRFDLDRKAPKRRTFTVQAQQDAYDRAFPAA